MKNIVITGASSMIGTAIAEACLQEDTGRIYCVVRQGCQKLYRLPDNDRIRIIFCDADAYGQLPALIPEPCEVFYHIAWSVTGSARNQNLKGQAANIGYTLDAVEAAAALGCRSFIGAGSQAEYGRLDLDRISPDSPVHPEQAYGIAKYAAGRLAAQAAEAHGMDWHWVRIFSVYGGYDKPGTMIASAIRKMLAGEHVAFTAGEQRWDYLYSGDAGRAFYLIGSRAAGSGIYCLGSGSARPLKEYIGILAEKLGTSQLAGIGERPYGRGAVMNLCADISALTADTGWQPGISFEDGIAETIAVIRQTAGS